MHSNFHGMKLSCFFADWKPCIWWPTKTLAKRYASGALADSSASGTSPEADEVVSSALSGRSVSLALGSMPTC